MGRPYRPRVRTHAELDVPKGDRLSVCLSVYEDDGMRGRVDNACVLQRELRTKKEKKKKTSRPAQLPKTIDVNVGTQRAAFALTAFPFLLSIEIREPLNHRPAKGCEPPKRVWFSYSVGATNDADHGGDWDLFSL
jgi:hypothetical protein